MINPYPVKIAWPNVPFTPRTEVNHIEFRIVDEDSSQVSLGRRPLYRYTGNVRMRINAPNAAGDRPFLAIADACIYAYHEYDIPDSALPDPMMRDVSMPRFTRRSRLWRYRGATSEGVDITIRLRAPSIVTVDPSAFALDNTVVASYTLTDVLVPYQVDIQ